MPVTYAVSESDKITDFDSDVETAVPSLARGRLGHHGSLALPSLPTIPSNRASVLTTPLARQLHRTNSVSLANGPAKVNPSARVPVDFRTLSIQVTETTRQQHHSHKGKKNVTDLASLDWHKISTQEACTRLGVAPDVGLDQAIVTRRLAKGKNRITPPAKNYGRRILGYIFGGFGSLLLVASVLCFIAWRPLGDPNPQASVLALAVVLLLVLAVSAAFNAWQDWSTGRTMSSIKGMLPSDVLVLRDGQTLKIKAEDIVIGDIVKVTLGAKVPADLRLVSCSSDLKFDRSILTGESKPVAATTDCTDENFMESRNIALQGTLCLSGSTLGVCVGTGDLTVFGRIAKAASGERPVKTSLELEITRFVLIIGGLAAAIAVLIVVFWAAFLRKEHPGFLNVATLLTSVVSVMVAFLPEGLPIAVTLSLTIIASSMSKKNVLCKSLSVVESLGCVSVICSDKTGTLTQNRMSVVNVVVGGASTDEDSDTPSSTSWRSTSVNDARQEAARETTFGNCIRALAAVAGLCNDATFEVETTEEPVETRKVNGDATDTGLLRFSEGISSVNKLRTSWHEVGKVAFNSKNKFAIKAFRHIGEKQSIDAFADASSENNNHLLLVKGAPDVLIRRCGSYLAEDGTTCDLDESTAASFSAQQAELASRGQRVLLLAKRVFSPKQIDIDNIDDEELLVSLNVHLTIVGLVALVDPLRDDTADTVRTCRGAGIRFMMVTGDMSLTATSIAMSCGIFTNAPSQIQHLEDLPRDLPLDQIADFDKDKPEDARKTSLVLSGNEILTMTESQWKQVLAFDEVVFARTSPQQKLQIVKAYQAADQTVAVTGDGVNDAAALKQANVGVAIAGGSEVATEAADLILLDNFSAIVAGIESGRLCYENLKKSILYLLPAGSFSELMPVLVNVFFGLPQVLSNIQMILICAVTDVLPALSLCLEKPEADLLTRKPRDRKKDRLADARLLGHAYLFVGVFESLTSMVGAFYFGFSRDGIPFSTFWLKFGAYDLPADVFNEHLAKAQSIYFFNLVIMQWFSLLAHRTRRRSIFQQKPIGDAQTSNVWLFPAMLAALAFAIFFSYVPVFQNIFVTRGVAAEYFFLPMAYGVVLLLIDEVRKWYNRARPQSLLARIAW
ncbi:hypothetical protein OIO90_005448 [Microbotryomycetes sp. JL221]|nr:hypothetical protein OIO90_005448 [Microbotryomycetes sp. JL221]